MKKTKKILLVDNFDSFTYNLVDEFEKRNCIVKVYRNNVPMKRLAAIVKKMKPDLMVISPGPGMPKDAGNIIAIIKKYRGKIPLFGVCMGEQAIIEAFGGFVGRAFETIHGKPTRVTHYGSPLFRGIPKEFQCGRYHSLIGQRLSEGLEVTAKSTSGLIMGVSHKRLFVEGIQFHPESILTPKGGKIIDNVLKMVHEKKPGGLKSTAVQEAGK